MLWGYPRYRISQIHLAMEHMVFWYIPWEMQLRTDLERGERTVQVIFSNIWRDVAQKMKGENQIPNGGPALGTKVS